MLKKIMYGVLLFLIMVFLYNTYLKDEDGKNYDIEKSIVSEEVTYTGEEFSVKADIEKNKPDEKIVEFYKADAQFRVTNIKGDKAVTDKHNNLTVDGNVYAVNSETGWEMQSDYAYYENKTGKLVLKGNVTGINKKDDLFLKSDYVESDINFTNLDAKGNIIAKTGENQLQADKANFLEKTKDLIVSGNVRIFNVNNKKGPNLSGVFTDAIYNLDNKILKTDKAFRIQKGLYGVSANKFLYDSNNGKGVLEDSLKLFGPDLNGSFTKAIYDSKKEKIDLVGKISGKKAAFDFYANNGEIDTKSGDLTLIGDVIVSDKENRLTADRLLMNEETGKLFATSKKEKGVKFVNKKYEMLASDILYDQKKYDLIINKDFEMINNSEEKFTAYGKKLKYNTISKIGIAKKVKIINQEGELEADNAEFNLKSNMHKFIGNVVAENEKDKTLTNLLEIDQNGGIAVMPDRYTMINKLDKSEITGTEAVYNQKTGDFNTYKPINYSSDRILAKGQNLKYNLTSGKGLMDGGVVLKDRGADIDLKGKKLIIDSKSFLEMPGDVEIINKDYIGKTNYVKYDVASEKVLMPNELKIKSRNKDQDAIVNNGFFDVKNKKFYGKKFYSRSAKNDLKANEVNYDLINHIGVFNSDVLLNDFEEKAVIKSDKLIYYQSTGFVISESNVKMDSPKLNIIGDKAKINVNKKVADIDGVKITTNSGDLLLGDSCFLDYTRNEFDLKGRVSGTVKSGFEDGKIVKFKSDLAKLFFIKSNKDDNLSFTRGEMKQNARFYYDEFILDGDYIEVDSRNETLFARGNTILTMNKNDKLSAQSIRYKLNSDLAYLRDNVVISSKSEDVGIVNTKADEGVYNKKEQKVELKGNIETIKGETKLYADQGVYLIKERLLKGDGNIFLTYDFKTADEVNEKRKNNKKDEEKVDKVIKEFKMPKEIKENDDFIELKKSVDNVKISWVIENETVISRTGEIRHPSYKEKDVTLYLKAKFSLGEIKKEVYYYITVKKYSTLSYMKSKIKRVKFFVDYDNKKVELLKNIDDVTISWNSNQNDKFSNIGELLVPYKNVNNEKIIISAIYSLGDKIVEQKYRLEYKSEKLRFIPLNNLNKLKFKRVKT